MTMISTNGNEPHETDIRTKAEKDSMLRKKKRGMIYSRIERTIVIFRPM